MSKRVNKSITDFFAKKVPRQELNTNNAKICPDDNLNQQIENVCCKRDSLQVCLFDIELCVGKKLSNKEKIDFFQKTWTPEKIFIFPITEFKNKKKLKFQLSWLEKWKWLAYSQKEDGAYCKYCVIFNKTEGGSQVLGNFCLKPFKIWYKAIEKFNIHDKCNYHLKSVEEYQNIVAIEAGKQDSIDLQLNKASKMQKELNRKIIIPVIESVIFCGRQGIALRGHRDLGILTTENPIENDGNFRALMRFHMNATKLSGDESYELARTNCAQNAQYTSWKIQNEIISACHDIILSKIIDEINNSKCFSVIADETADVAGIEQFSLCVRYFDSKSKIIKEQFLKFVPVMDLSGSALASIIIKELTDMKIEMQYIRGQGYDGAASMSGRFNGVQSCIKKEYKTAIYVHCSAHSLNLAITYACGVQGIRNTMGTIEKVFVFLNTPKRQASFSKHVKELNQEGIHKEKLKRLCATRWVERHDSVEVFDQLLPAIHSCLEEMTSWADNETSTKAHILFLALKSCEFNVSLIVLKKIFRYTVSLCKYLQKPNIDLIQALEYVNNVVLQINSVRNNVDEEFLKCFEELQKKSNDLDFEIKIPRITKRHTYSQNTPDNTVQDYFKVFLFIPFLDSFISQLNDRFINHNEIIQGFQLLFPIAPLTEQQEKLIKNLAEFYANDVENSSNVLAEVKIWHHQVFKLRVETNLKMVTVIEVISNCNIDLYPNVYKLLKILLTLPVTSCEAERSFSTLKRIKTYLRNSISASRLNGLAALNIHREITVTTDDIIRELSEKKRRLDFVI